MKKILLVIFLLSISICNAFAKIEKYGNVMRHIQRILFKWECFADTTVVGTYKLDTDNATVAYLSNGNWKYYDWCCDITFDKEKQLLYFPL